MPGEKRTAKGGRKRRRDTLRGWRDWRLGDLFDKRRGFWPRVGAVAGALGLGGVGGHAVTHTESKDPQQAQQPYVVIIEQENDYRGGETRTPTPPDPPLPDPRLAFRDRQMWRTLFGSSKEPENGEAPKPFVSGLLGRVLGAAFPKPGGSPNDDGKVTSYFFKK